MADQGRTTVKEESRAPEGVERTTTGNVYLPQTDIVETEDALILVADVPGVDERGLDITLEKDVLTIQGTVRSVDVSGYQPAYLEYGVGDFERSFKVSDEIDRGGIEATVKDGVLRVKLPKSKEAAGKKIQVKAG